MEDNAIKRQKRNCFGMAIFNDDYSERKEFLIW